jgi:hypothetical protein
MRPPPLSERNKAIAARREAPPRLPPAWGSSLSRAPFYPGGVAERLPYEAGQKAMRLYDRLCRLAYAGDELPSATVICGWLDIWAHSKALGRLFAELESAGLVHMSIGASPHGAGWRVVRIVETGAILRSVGAPLSVVP